MKTEEQIKKMCKIYKETNNITEITRRVDTTRKTARRYLKERGLWNGESSKNEIKRQDLDHKKFNYLSNKKKYWIGFLMADGYIGSKHESNPQITLTLKASDRQHLIKFKKFLSIPNEIKHNKRKNDTYTIQFRSIPIAKQLKKFGVINNKSGGTEVKEIEGNRHFWRGMIDGDGHISLPKKYPRIALYNCKRVVEQFKNFCQNVNENIETSVYESDATYSYTVYSDQAKDVIKELYIDQDIALDRKERRAISHITSLDLC